MGLGNSELKLPRPALAAKFDWTDRVSVFFQQISDEAKDLVGKLLQKEPNRRLPLDQASFVGLLACFFGTARTVKRMDNGFGYG